MADDTKALEIQILTKYLGAEEAKKAVGDLDKLTDSQKGAGQAAEAANPHFENSRQLFNGINHIVPGLGHELHAAFAGPLGPVIILALAIAEVKKKLSEYNDELDKQGEVAAQPMIDAVKEVQTAWDTAKEKFGEYLGAVADAGKNKDVIDEQIEQQKDIEEANLKGLAKNLTPEQLRALKQSSDIGFEEQEFNERNTPGYQAHLQRAAQDAINNSADAGSRLEQNKSELEKTRAALDPNSEAGKKFQAQQDAAVEELNASKTALGLGPDNPKLLQDVADAQAEINRLANERANLLSRSAELESQQTRLAQQKKEADDARDAAVKEGERNSSRVAELPGKIDVAEHAQKQQEVIEGLSKLFSQYTDGNATLHAIVKHHIEQSTTLAQEQQAMKNALQTLKDRVSRSQHAADLH